MSDNETQKHGADKLIGWFKGLAVAIGGLLMVDQSKIAGETVPALWEDFKDVAKRGLTEMQIAYEHAATWVQTQRRRATWVTIIWWVLAAALLVAGVVGKSRGWSNGSTLTMRLVGTYLFAAYWYVAAAFAKPFYYGLHALKNATLSTVAATGEGINHWTSKAGVKIPTLTLKPADADKIDASATAFQRFFYTLASLTLLFGTFFVYSGEAMTAVGLLLVGMPLAFMSAVSAKHGWTTVWGWRLLAYAALASFVVMTFMVFGDALVPAPIRKWFSRRNQSELIAMVLLGIPAVLWLMSAFWKSKADALSTAAKRLSWISAALLVFLWIKGPISSKELTGHETTVDEVKRGLGMTKTENHAMAIAPSGTYMAPPTSASVGATYRPIDLEAPKPQAAVPTRTHRKIAVPPDEAPKEYTNPVQELDDLEALGY